MRKEAHLLRFFSLACIYLCGESVVCRYIEGTKHDVRKSGGEAGKKKIRRPSTRFFLSEVHVRTILLSILGIDVNIDMSLHTTEEACFVVVGHFSPSPFSANAS